MSIIEDPKALNRRNDVATSLEKQLCDLKQQLMHTRRLSCWRHLPFGRFSFTAIWLQFKFQLPCSTAPCQNGGTCQGGHGGDAFKCLCHIGFVGKYCEKALQSCKEVYDAQRSKVSQVASLCFGSRQLSVFCHMGDFGCGDGGWTPVMKINGSNETFEYMSPYWENTEEYRTQGGMTGFDSEQTKLPSYWNTPFNKICLGMRIGDQTKFIFINKSASSLYSLIGDGKYRNLSVGRNKWKTLIGSQASLQHNCNKEGFNVKCSSTGGSRARIGIVGNNEQVCSSCDSRLGFGSWGMPIKANACGNVAKHGGDNGNKNLKAMGYILVQ
ncbi:uncharacterized protein LOC111346322 [Stylophora pistillata]|uniref:uncharacterized protein LOC111346322 n=1 Tax=Stylophora pistillata TaxID=50429 RepID=UPI000C038D15|nr:uncharacterized protein LOC111346322 [Stylophora pistillata]